MNNKLLPISSLIKINGEKAVISGYTMIEVGEKLAVAYIVIPYPYGYSGNTSYKVIEATKVEILEIGLETQESDSVIRYYENLNNIASSVSTKQMVQYMKKAAFILEEELENE